MTKSCMLLSLCSTYLSFFQQIQPFWLFAHLKLNYMKMNLGFLFPVYYLALYLKKYCDIALHFCALSTPEILQIKNAFSSKF